MQGPRKDSLLSQPLGCLLAERDDGPVDHRVCTGSCDATASYFQSEECLSRVISYGVLLEITGCYLFAFRQKVGICKNSEVFAEF